MQVEQKVEHDVKKLQAMAARLTTTDLKRASEQKENNEAKAFADNLEDAIKRGEYCSVTDLKKLAEKRLAEYRRVGDINDNKRILEKLKQGIDVLLSSWQSGTLQNKEMDEELNKEAVNRLMNQRKDLKATLEEFVSNNIKAQKSVLFQRWVSEGSSKGIKEQTENFVNTGAVLKHLYENWPCPKIEADNKCLADAFLIDCRNEIFYEAFRTNSKVLGEHQTAVVMKQLREKLDLLENPDYEPSTADPMHKLSDEVGKRATESMRAFAERNSRVRSIKPFYVDAVERIVNEWREGRLQESFANIIKSFIKYKGEDSELNTNLWWQSIRVLIDNYRNGSLRTNTSVNAVNALQHLDATLRKWLDDKPAGDPEIRLAMGSLLSAWKRKTLPPSDQNFLDAQLKLELKLLQEGIELELNVEVRLTDAEERLKNQEERTKNLEEEVKQLRAAIETLSKVPNFEEGLKALQAYIKLSSGTDRRGSVSVPRVATGVVSGGNTPIASPTLLTRYASHGKQQAELDASFVLTSGDVSRRESEAAATAAAAAAATSAASGTNTSPRGVVSATNR